MEVREAVPDEVTAVMCVLDGAMLAVGLDAVRDRIEGGDVFVCVEEGRVLGAIVIDPVDGRAHVVGIAVRPGRRGRGVGSALVEAACDRHDRLAAEFDGGVRPFYESLGFEIEPLDGERYRGRLEGVAAP